MRILVIGASGLIGSALVARLVTRGDNVVAVARHVERASRKMPAATWAGFDIARATAADSWLPLLRGVEAVVNCAGVLQDAPGESTRGVHADGVAALCAACERVGVRRVVHLSAIGVDRGTPSDFSRTKLAGDTALMQSDLDWVILRPSVVVGPAAYGGSAMFRGLAALPLLPVMPDTGPLQIVQLDDVVATILFFLGPGAPSRVALDLAGPQPLSFPEVVAQYRGWLGGKPARQVRVARLAAALLYGLGDIAGWLGWRPPLRSTARREIVRGALGDPGPWQRLTGIEPTPLPAALTSRPASVQERWFAGLYVLKPVIFVVLALFWIVTGLLSVGPGYPIGVQLMLEGGAGRLSGPSVIAGGLVDLVIGLAIAWRRTARYALWAGVALSLYYAAAGTVLLPRLWIEPLGPMLKIWPIMLLMLVALAVLEDR